MLSDKRIPEGLQCACGCGNDIPTRFSSGAPKYHRKPGPYYIHGHNGRLFPPLAERERPLICECGCNQPLVLKAWHSKSRGFPRFLPGHWAKAGLGHAGHRQSLKRVTAGTLCSCGCGEEIPLSWPNGRPRYVIGKGVYAVGHKPSQRGRAGLRGEASPTWKGGRFIDRNGYVSVITPLEHPRRGLRIAEHRLIMERKLERYLEKGESVHHLNGIRDDNRPENLELWTKPQTTGIRVKDIPHCPTCTCGAV